MEDSRISRRAFLKKFAVLSMLSVGGVRCTAQPEYGAPPIVITVEPDLNIEYGVIAVPEYGAPPVELNELYQMTYLDENGTEKTLYGSAIVPTSTRFIIYFSTTMDESSQNAVSLSDVDGNAVQFELAWLREQTTLEIIPDAELQYATQYILEVGPEAKNSLGQALQLTGTERAEFTTVEP